LADSIVLRTSGTIHEDIQVVDIHQVRYMRFGTRGGWQGALNQRNLDRPVFPYQRAYAATLSAVGDVSRFFSLGVGTGTSLRSTYKAFPDAELYGVEMDERVVELAISHFESPNHQTVNYWIGDGVAFLCNVDLSFDLMFVDAYMANDIYAPTIDPAFVSVLKAAITANGTALMNIIAMSPARGRVGTFIDEAKRHFPVVGALPVGIPGTEQNTLVAVSNNEAFETEWRRALTESKHLNVWERWMLNRRLRFF